ncbi:hypothetical protein AVEN_147635-1 [Araneus ventricosus]|uniref:Uncharacterized protein n=1 Tax=Araneus ventricosus TaxID=182803 RepID=A0A4Y2HEH5_ARAVE|nr:hypothetical protein AVEN_147635-1 [Araneus ventricosus]
MYGTNLLKETWNRKHFVPKAKRRCAALGPETSQAEMHTCGTRPDGIKGKLGIQKQVIFAIEHGIRNRKGGRRGHNSGLFVNEVRKKDMPVKHRINGMQDYNSIITQLHE